MPQTVATHLADDEDFDILHVSTPQTAVPFVAAGLGVTPTTQRIAEKYSGVVLQEAPGWLEPMHATLLWRRGVEITPVMQRWMEVTRRIARRRSEQGL